MAWQGARRATAVATSKHDTEPDLETEDTASSGPSVPHTDFPEEDGWDLDPDPQSPDAKNAPPSSEARPALAPPRVRPPAAVPETRPQHGLLAPVGGSVSAELAAVSWKKPDVGDVLGSYRILEFIGGGGMALIYRAEHVRLRREAALKVLRPALASQSEEVLRFFEEARAVNEIRHPNIVDIFDFIENTDLHPPLVYMVMELLSGEDLHSLIRRRGQLDPAEVFALVDQVADALEAVHGKNIIHRDLKPNNIHVEQAASDSPRIKILDFGLVKAFGRREGRALTSPEVLVGTPEYMAPEQVLGAPLDHRTDIYTLGLVIYEMLAGRRAFDGEAGEVLVRQAKDPPPALSEHRASEKPLPLPLVALVNRCLEKDPADRFQSMSELRQGLAECPTEADDKPALEIVELVPKANTARLEKDLDALMSTGPQPALDDEIDALVGTGPQPAVDLPASAEEPLVVPRSRHWVAGAAVGTIAVAAVATLLLWPRTQPPRPPAPAQLFTATPDLGLDAAGAVASMPDARATAPDAMRPTRRRAAKRPRRRRARRARPSKRRGAANSVAKPIAKPAPKKPPPADPPKPRPRREVGEGTVDPFAH